MKARHRSLLVALLAAATAATFGTTDDAEAAAERLRVKPVRDGVVVSVFVRRPRTVSFTLAGRPLARIHASPYRVLVRGHNRAGRRTRVGVWLIARDSNTGRRLARVRLAARRAARPTVSIKSGPDRVTVSTDARLTFAAARATSTWCSLDSRPAVRCSSPTTYDALGLGSHLFTVRAQNAAGTAKASYAWTVVEPAAVPPPPLGPTTPGRAAPPTPPSAYTPPEGAVHVSTSAGLLTALANDRPSDIVLADGVYDHSAPFWNSAGHRVYAARLGGAVLHTGFVLGHNWGPGNGLLQGLTFDVSDPAKTLHSSVVHVWGTGAGSRLLDLTIEGHKAVSAGVMVRQPNGAVVQRVVARNFLDWGVIVDANILGLTVERPPLVEDVVATDVTWPVPAASNGRSEACVWIGNTATVRRIYAARCAWEGVWTGTATRGAVLEDVRVVESGVGVYAEHYNSAGTTFRRLDIGPGVKTGVNCEWADPGWNRIAGCIDVVIEDSFFDTSLIGVYMDEGTTRTTIRRSVFRNQKWAAIGDHKGIGNSYHDNDVSGLAAGGVPLSHDHLFEHCGCGP